MRYQLLLDKIVNFDLDNYCIDNHLEKQDMIRHLIREEIYRRQSLSKKKIDQEPKQTIKARKIMGDNWKG